MRFNQWSKLCLAPVFCAALCLTGLAAASEPSDGYFRTSDGIRIHYLEIGKGTPVILIHGYSGNAEGNWFANGIGQALATNHRVIAIDCRNHGKSDKPQPIMPGRAEDVVELMDYLHIPKAHFHGYSMGGMIVARLLTMIPERMISAGFGGSGIVEVDPQWRDKVPPDKTGEDPQQAEATQKLRRSRLHDVGMTPQQYAKMREEWQRQLATKNAARQDASKDGKSPGSNPSGTPANAAGGDRALLFAGLRPTRKLDLTKLNIPMLAINGELDRPNLKTTRMAREVKDFTNVVLPGKSHLTAIMAGYMPKEYLEATVAFINAHDPKP
jgi:pimeloyl-ACP methyl ester carboxylesterase